jgi:hypothetical protein
MENNIKKSNENIIVDIHGETDWVRFSFDPKALALLKNPQENLAKLGFQLGKLLDGDPAKPLSEERESNISVLLARYVANLKSYETMLAKEYKSMMITVFKTTKEKLTGYTIRVAGMLPDDLNEVHVFINGMPMPNLVHHFMLLVLMNQSSAFYTENYHKGSFYHDLMRQAKEMAGEIEFRRYADPSLQ